MPTTGDSRDLMLQRVIAFAATDGLADKSLREIAAGVGTSHRMLLYHFGSREGLLAAIVATIEAQQRGMLGALARGGAAGPNDLMRRQWEQVSDPALRPYVRLFFAVVGLAVQGVPGTLTFLESLTDPWLAEAGAVAERLGVATEPAALRLGVAVTRGLLLELLAGADSVDVDASYQLFTDMWQRWAEADRP